MNPIISVRLVDKQTSLSTHVAYWSFNMLPNVGDYLQIGEVSCIVEKIVFDVICQIIDIYAIEE